jgi:hypothetical protein
MCPWADQFLSQDTQRGHASEIQDQGSIQHHVTGCEDLPIETSILIEYQFEQY